MVFLLPSYTEAKGRERGGVLAEGAYSSSHQLWCLGERTCKLSQWGLGRSPGRQTYFVRFKCSEWPHPAVYCCLLFLVIMLIILGVYRYNFQVQ